MHNIRTQNPDGYDGHLKEVRELLPDMTSYEQFVRERQQKAGTKDKNWNQVSILKLVTGKH